MVRLMQEDRSKLRVSILPLGEEKTYNRDSRGTSISVSCGSSSDMQLQDVFKNMKEQRSSEDSSD